MVTTLQLFDDIERTYAGPASHSEDRFAYYNRSSRPGVASIRAALQQWFERYPQEHQSELWARFRSRNDRHFDSTFFELFLHELLLRLKCKVEVHPSPASAGGKSPDFLVTPEAGQEFYLEAIVATGRSTEEVSREAIIDLVYDQIDKLESPNFFVHVRNVEGLSNSQPSGKRVRAFLKKRIDSLDPDVVAKEYTDRLLDFPSWFYEEEGLTIEFGVVPKSPEGRLKEGGRAIGVFPMKTRWGSDAPSIRDAVTKKGGRYGELEVPYVIAVNAITEWGLDHIDAMEALFGTETFLFAPGVTEPRMVRKPDGAFRNKAGPAYTRVSAVLLAFGAHPPSLASLPVRLYHNPWAQNPYSGPLCQLDQAVPEGDTMHRVSGTTIAALFGFPSDWPGR